MKIKGFDKRSAMGIAVVCTVLVLIVVPLVPSWSGEAGVSFSAVEAPGAVAGVAASGAAAGESGAKAGAVAAASASACDASTDGGASADDLVFEDGLDASAGVRAGAQAQVTEQSESNDLASNADAKSVDEAGNGKEATSAFVLAEGAKCVQDVVLVGVSEGLNTDEVSRRLADSNVAHVAGVCEVVPGVVEVSFDSATASVEDEVNRLLSLPFVESAQPNYVYETADSESLDAAKGSGVEAPSGSSKDEAGKQAEGEPAGGEPVGGQSAGEPAAGQGAEGSAGGQPTEQPAGQSVTDQRASEQSAEGQSAEEDIPAQKADDANAAHGVALKAESAGDAPLSNDTNSRLQWDLRSINVKGAWDAGYDGNGVSVAVIDADFDVNHPDLQGKIVGAYNVMDNSTDVRGNGNMHGFYVCSVIAPTKDNNFGIAGVSPGARVVPVLASKDREYTSANLLKAYEYILSVRERYNIRVVNTSFGFDWSNPTDADLLVYRKIDEAYAAGIVTVASAGNGQGPYCHCPCDYGTTVGVTGLCYPRFDPEHYAGYDAGAVAFSPISNFNAEGETSKNICAPGWDVPSIRNDDYRAEAYGISGGTSFAAPHVAGTLALMFQANPSLSSAQAVAALYGSARDLGDLGWDRFHGYGEVDAAKAVDYARKGVWLQGPQWVATGANASYSCASGAGVASLACSNGGVAQASVSGGRATLHATRSGVAQLAGTSASGGPLQTDVFVVGPIDGSESIEVGDVVRYGVSQPYPFAYRWSLDGKDVGTGSYANVSVGSAGGHTLVATLVADPSVRLEKHLAAQPMDIAKAQVDAVPSQLYTGGQICPKPVVRVGSARLKEGADYSLSYENNVGVGTATVVVSGRGNYRGTKKASFEIVPEAHVRYRSHVQNIGWQGWKANGALSGTSGKGLRLEGLKVELVGAPYSGGIEYRTHIQNIGWQGMRANGAMSGTSGRGLRLEALELRLTGDMATHYNVWYRVHAQDFGWLGWTSNGGSSGTATLGKRLEALEVRLLPKGSPAPGSTKRAYVTRQIAYSSHVQNMGWQGSVFDGKASGTSGKGLRLEGIKISLSDSRVKGSVEYRTHVQNVGWQGYVRNGKMSGTSGKGLRLEAIQIRLKGAVEQQYDVWYRVHAQNFGWMGWAKNDERAGTQGFGYRLEAIQIRLLPKGSNPPGTVGNAFRAK
ncbi:MAG: S8 family serine peptidase [Atopobiaceae bacterium]|nr:S8 family serine peptidase [Atopobiaceae bacterium]